MATNNTFEDFRRIIAERALIRATEGVRIVHDERSGAESSWLFDLRAVMLDPAWLARYAEIFWERYGDRYPFQVGGIETAGIPLVTAIILKGNERGTPVNGFFLRKTRKRKGLMKYVEGTLTDQPIILVDDLANSGDSLTKCVQILRDEGHAVREAFVLIAFRESLTLDIPLHHLFTLPDFGIPFIKSRHASETALDIVWRYRAPHPSFHLVMQKSAPVLDERNAYFGCDDGFVRAIDLATGSLAWEYEIGAHPKGKGILSSPALHQGVLYIGAYSGEVLALDAHSGARVWRYDEAEWVGSSPALAPERGLVYIGLEFNTAHDRGGIVALDMKTGDQKWIAYHREYTHGSPLYIPEASLVVIGSNDETFYAYDAESGALRWQFAARGAIKSRAAYDPKRRVISFGTMGGLLYVLRVDDGTPLHAREMGAGIYSIPLVVNDTLYVSSLDKRLYAIDCATWNERWRFETGGRIFASPVCGHDSIWIGSNDCKLYELDAKTGAEKHHIQLTERIVNAVAFHGSDVLVPTVANELYRLHPHKK